MTKRVAFVDIDGCLVIAGKINQALVEQLKSYDEVILFTQRSQFLQIGQITRACLQQGEQDPIINTCDAVDALSHAIKKPVKVSTSVDQYFGAPTQYYEETLKPFEKKLKKEINEKRERINLTPYNESVKIEVDAVRKSLGKGEKEEAASFYPQGKVEQCLGLMTHLPGLLDTQEDITVDFFDDNEKNLCEIIDSSDRDLPQKPNCMVVSGNYICPIAKFQEKYGKNANPRDNKIKALLQEDPIAKLSQYIADREQERFTSKSEFKSKWAEFFRPNLLSATTKISAAKKAIKILQGEEDVVMTENELKALQQGRSKDLIGNAIDTIKESQQNNTWKHVL